MGRASGSQVAFNIFNDQNSREGDEATSTNNRFTALRQIPVSESQNCQTITSSPVSIESHSHVSNENYELNPVKTKYRHRLTRPIIAPDTFNPLQTVPEGEGESQYPLKPVESNLATSTQHCLEIPGNYFSAISSLI